MRKMKAALAALTIALLCAAACTPLVSVQYNYDPDFDFESIERFQWLGIHNDGSVPAFNLQRLQNALVAELERKGLHESEAAQAQILVAGYLGITPAQAKKWEYSHGLYWTEKMTSVPQGTLVIDVVDANTRRLVWRAVGNGTYQTDVTPEQRDRNAESIAKKLFKSFPPSR